MTNWEGIAPDTGDGIRTSPEKAYRHSLRVKRLRLVVPAIAAGLVATYVFSATPPTIDREFLEQFNNIDSDTKALRLTRPRHLGYDLNGDPFEVAAAAAERSESAPGLIELENPEAFRGLGDGEQITAMASKGRMNTESNRLDLNDNVRVRHAIGGEAFTLNTDAAEVDFETQTVTSSTTVRGEGDRGTVAADRMTSYGEDGRLVLEGNVRMRFVPAAADSTGSR